jgi:hypothetical protein
VRFAYADPPYPGMARRWYRNHPDYGGEVDHAELIERLERDFPDGWALSTSARALKQVLALCPDGVRICAWTKPMSAMFVNSVSVQYSWEPVLLMRGRDRRGRNPVIRDWLAASPDGYTWRARPEGHVTGAKPRAFCYWMFDLLGAQPDDELMDLFPGSGAVGHAWETWSAQPSLFDDELARVAIDEGER